MQKEIHKDEKLWTPQFVLLLLISFFNSVGSTMISPTLPKYAVSLGAGLTVVGTISGVFALTALTIRPFSGLIVDRLNKKKILAIAASVITCAAFGYAFSTSVNMLIFFRILHGAAIGVSMTANASLVSEHIPRSRLGEGISFLAIGMLVAMSISPNIGLYIGAAYGYRYSFLIAAASSCIAFALMFLIKYESPRKSDKKKEKTTISIKDMIAKEVLIYAAIAGMLSVVNNVESTFLPLYADSKGIQNIGIYYTVSACVVFSVRILAGRIFDKKGLAFVLYPALAFSATAMFIIGNANMLWVILIAAGIKAVGQGLAHPALQASSIKKLDPSRSGVATSTFYLGCDIGQGFGPIVTGAIASRFGYDKMFFFCTGLFIFGMLTYYIYSSKFEKQPLKANFEADNTDWM